MSILLWFFQSPVGRWLSGGIVAVFAVLSYNAYWENRGAVKALAKVEKAATHNVEKANKARADAAKIPDNRLRDRYWRND